MTGPPPNGWVWELDVPPPELMPFGGPHSLSITQCKTLGEARMDSAVLVVTCRLVLVCSAMQGAYPSRKIPIDQLRGMLISHRAADVGTTCGTMILLRSAGQPDLLLLLPAAGHAAPTPHPRKDPVEVISAVHHDLTGEILEVVRADRDSPKLLSVAKLEASSGGAAGAGIDERAAHSNIRCRCHPRGAAGATLHRRGSTHPTVPPPLRADQKGSRAAAAPPHSRSVSPPLVGVLRGATATTDTESPRGWMRGTSSPAAPAAQLHLRTSTPLVQLPPGQPQWGGGVGGVAGHPSAPPSAVEDLQVRFNRQQESHVMETASLRQEIAGMKRLLAAQRGAGGASPATPQPPHAPQSSVGFAPEEGGGVANAPAAAAAAAAPTLHTGDDAPPPGVLGMREQVREALESQARDIASLQRQLSEEQARRERAEAILRQLQLERGGGGGGGGGGAIPPPPAVGECRRHVSPQRPLRQPGAPPYSVQAVGGGVGGVEGQQQQQQHQQPSASHPIPSAGGVSNGVAVSVSASVPMSDRATSPLPEEGVGFGAAATADAGTDPPDLRCFWRGAMESKETMTHAGGGVSVRRREGPRKDMGVMAEPVTATQGTSTWHAMVGDVGDAAVQTDSGFTFDKGVVTDVAWPFPGLPVEAGWGGGELGAAAAPPAPHRPALPEAQTPQPPLQQPQQRHARASESPLPAHRSIGTASTSLPEFDSALAFGGGAVGGGHRQQGRRWKGRGDSVSTTTSDLDSMLRECTELLGRAQGLAPGEQRSGGGGGGGGAPPRRGGARVRGVPPNPPAPTTAPSRVDMHTYWYPLMDGNVAPFSREGAESLGFMPGSEVTLQGDVYTIVGTLEGKLHGHRESDPGAVPIHHLV